VAGEKQEIVISQAAHLRLVHELVDRDAVFRSVLLEQLERLGSILSLLISMSIRHAGRHVVKRCSLCLRSLQEDAVEIAVARVAVHIED
jgi:hypothetical protein